MKISNLKPQLLLLTAFFIISIAFAQQSASRPAYDNADNYPAGKNESGGKKDKKRKDEFKVFGGVNFNKLIMEEKIAKPTMAIGWDVGASYKRGKFFYWQLGVTYNNSVYNVIDTTLIPGSHFDGVFSIRNIDVPVTVGLNFLSFISRIVGLRVYVSTVPQFAIGVSDNKLNVSMDNINTFNLYGQAGVGVDVAFIFVEAGYSYGFMDLLKNDITSNPNQVFVNLGFRF